MIAKTRPDDFRGEIDHLEQILLGADPKKSPIALERGLDTMLVIAAAHLSNQKNRTVKINREAGYRIDALEVL